MATAWATTHTNSTAAIPGYKDEEGIYLCHIVDGSDRVISNKAFFCVSTCP